MKRRQKILWEESENDVQSTKREAVKKETVAQTIGGKDVRIRCDPLGLWYAEFTSGGELPDRLKQRWTRRVDAFDAVKEYVDNA